MYTNECFFIPDELRSSAMYNDQDRLSFQYTRILTKDATFEFFH